MTLHSALFGDPQVDECFSDRARVQTMLDFEVALAEAHVDAGLAPAAQADAVRQAAQADRCDIASLVEGAARSGNVAIPLVAQLRERAATIDKDAADLVHAGATSQDAIDTGLVLTLRAALPVLLASLDRAAAASARHARAYRDTPQTGRTWLQQSTPITFGLKAAGWLDALARIRRQLAKAGDDAFVLQFGGASGTLASLGASADRVASHLARRLNLRRPALPWHSHRDRVASFACTLGVVAGTLGKIASDLALLAQTEVREAFGEPRAGHGGSSTMPHKQNPVGAAVALAAAVRAPGLVATMLGAMPQEHERGLGGWHAEWETLPELLTLTAGAARAVAETLDRLVVDETRMARNLEITRGLIQAEAVAAALATHLGRASAHDRVEVASRRAVGECRALADVLGEDADVVRALGADTIQRLLAPGSYLGQAGELVDRVLDEWERGSD